jgi:hypothetical protein
MEHACFISFSSGIGKDTKFARYFYDEFIESLAGYNKTLSVFKYDVPACESRRNAAAWPLWIQHELCHSAMMFAVCAPNYFTGSPACVSEFWGMHQLGTRRESILGKPALDWIQALRLGDNIPMPALDGRATVTDFPEAFADPRIVRDSRRYKSRVAQFAKDVYMHWKWLHEDGRVQLLATAAPCSAFNLPDPTATTPDPYPHFGGVR